MDSLATLISILYQFATNGAFLLLSSLGLIVILGMMNIINLAHGELMMMGAYTASIAWHRGVPFWLCAVLAFIVVGVFGALLERAIVRRFYGRELGALVVTWGISLILSQGALMVFGPFLPAIPIPGGSVGVGQYSFSVYWLMVIALSCVLIAGLWALLQPHYIWAAGARRDAECRNGEGARCRYRTYLHAHLQPRRRSRGLFRRAICADGVDRAIHGPAICGAGLYHRGCRWRHQCHHRRGRQQPAAVAGQNANWFRIRCLRRHGRVAARGSCHHSFDAGGHLAVVQRRIDRRNRFA